MTQFIIEYCVELLFGIIAAALGTGYKKLSSKLKEQELMKEGILAILHDRLYQACEHNLTRGYCTIDEIKNLECLYNSYHSLGGNGTGTELYERVQSLPIRSGNVA